MKVRIAQKGAREPCPEPTRPLLPFRGEREFQGSVHDRRLLAEPQAVGLPHREGMKAQGDVQLALPRRNQQEGDGLLVDAGVWDLVRRPDEEYLQDLREGVGRGVPIVEAKGVVSRL